MKIVVAWMNPRAPAPAGGGTTEGWFEYYKLPEEGEVWLPFHPDAPIREGDDLWFLMGQRILGHVPVIRIDANNSNGWLEVWYQAEEVQTPLVGAGSLGKLLDEADCLFPLWGPRMYR